MVALGEAAKQIANIIEDTSHNAEDALPIIPEYLGKVSDTMRNRLSKRRSEESA
jgi:hypothetical protein